MRGSDGSLENRYTWKIGIELASSRQLSTNKPVLKNDVIADLCTGGRYFVQNVFRAGPKDRVWAMMPDTVIQTWPLRALSEIELDELRKKASYISNASSQPLGDMVFA